MTNSNGKQRVAIDPSIFGHEVVATLTGREMSTPDVHKPVLVEVEVKRTDNALGVFWVPVEATSPLTYEVSVMCVQDSHASPTDAVLSTIEWLRSPQPGGITFNVFCPDDKVTYNIEAMHNDEDDTWSATVNHATEPNPQNRTTTVPRRDLMPSEEG